MNKLREIMEYALAGLILMGGAITVMVLALIFSPWFWGAVILIFLIKFLGA